MCAQAVLNPSDQAVILQECKMPPPLNFIHRHWAVVGTDEYNCQQNVIIKLKH